jgi:hypothetical protein
VAFEKIAGFDGRPPAQVTKAWGIMPLYQVAMFQPLMGGDYFGFLFYVTRESIPSSVPAFAQ